eukprot:tig00021358_g20809.t1
MQSRASALGSPPQRILSAAQGGGRPLVAKSARVRVVLASSSALICILSPAAAAKCSFFWERGQRSGCRSRTRGFWTAVASEFLCLRPLGRRCGSERCAVAATAFRALSISVWALGDSERSAFDVGHGQGMLEAGRASCSLLAARSERGDVPQRAADDAQQDSVLLLFGS